MATLLQEIPMPRNFGLHRRTAGPEAGGLTMMFIGGLCLGLFLGPLLLAAIIRLP